MRKFKFQSPPPRYIMGNRDKIEKKKYIYAYILGY